MTGDEQEGAGVGTTASGLEEALAATEKRVDAALTAVAAVTRELKRAKTGAVRGQTRDLRRALEAAVGRVEEAAQVTTDAAGSFDFDEREHLASGGYVEELLAEAAARDVAMFEADGQVLCYPSVIRIIASDPAVEVDRRRERRLRPSVLVGLLATAQARPPRFRPEPFLESLEGGYDLVTSRDGARPGSVVKLDEIWKVLTLMPTARKDYARPEFARDLYLLDSSGVTRTRSGRVAGWHASTGTRGTGTLTTVAKTGQQQLYWGISFKDRP
jgi:hypothetical protein